MTFKVGDRVKTVTDQPQYNGLMGTIVGLEPGGDFVVDTPNYPYLPFNSSELKIVPEWVEALQYEESHPASDDFGTSVQEVVNEVRDTLIAKNKAYGNSALEPVRVFSTADPIEQLRVRIDDKLSRLKSSLNDDNEDTVLDLMGYLVLLRIATRKQDTE